MDGLGCFVRGRSNSLESYAQNREQGSNGTKNKGRRKLVLRSRLGILRSKSETDEKDN